MRDIYKDSIVLIGPAGAGKSLLAQELSAKTGLPIVSSDRLRHLIGLSEIKNLDISRFDERQQKDFADSLKLWETLLNVGFSEEKLSNFYAKHGFDKNISQEMEKKFGPIGWHCYQKQFEMELLKYIVTNLNQPVILDLGAGMAISLDRDYEKIKERMLREDGKLYEKCFNKKRSCEFKDIKKILSKFDNVVYLQLPKDYMMKMDKAAKDKLNDAFLSTKQYEQLSKMTVNVDGMINGSEKNNDVAKKIADQIVKEKEKT